MNQLHTRSDFSKAQALGSAKTAVAHWWMQRVTAVALIPLTLWFTAALIAMARHGYDALVAWLKSPVSATLMILLMIALFYHMALGLQVVIEDYVHSTRMKLAVLAVKLGCSVLAVAGVLSVVRISLSG